jgi:hypothetical protein
MPVTPTGTLSVPLHDIRARLRASPAWIAWCGNSTKATADTYLISSPGKVPRPHAIIDLDPQNFQRTRDGATIGRFIQRGSVLVYLAALAPANATDEDAVTDFLNRADGVLADLETSAGLGGYGSVINGYTIAGGPSRIDKDQRDKCGDLIEMALLLDVTVYP